MAASVSQPRRLYWVSLPAGHMPKVVIIWLTVSHQGAQRDRAHAAFPHPGFVRPTCSPLSRSVGFVWPSVVLFMSKHCFHYGFARSLRSRKLASFAENGKNGCAIQPRRPLERFPIRLTRKLQGSWPESALRFDVCRISYRKTGVHFSGKCSSAVNLKFLSLLAASSFRNFKFKTALES
jgi:hypothetical protein